MKIRLEIPFRLPSLNEYTNECRKNRYAGSTMKAIVERDLGLFIRKLPHFEKPIIIEFEWVEENEKRDLDNICFAKKFILDAMVKCKVLKDDNIRFVAGFVDKFSYDKESKVILNITEIEQ